jgi:hypothetical protein
MKKKKNLNLFTVHMCLYADKINELQVKSESYLSKMKPKNEKEKKKEPPKKEEKCICEICTCGYVATDS